MHTHIELLDRFMSGKTSPEEERTLLAWFRDPDHKEEIIAFYKSRWKEASGKKLSPEIQGQMFCEIKKRIRQEKKTLEIKKKPHTLWKWLSYAAVALICIGLGIGSHWYNMRQVPPPDPLDYVVLADNGQRASVVLPDGTKVWLNSHTKLNYKSDYGVKERSVSLSGEAYFEVSKDTLRRFLVNAGDMEVEALGTAFNVKAYEEDDEVVTIVMDGKTLVDVTDYTYDAATGKISLKKVTGELAITAQGVQKSYAVAIMLKDLTSDISQGKKIKHGETLTGKLSVVTPQYGLPSTIEVMMGGKVLAAGSGYSYDPKTGEIEIKNVTAEVSIKASGAEIFQVKEQTENIEIKTSGETVKEGEPFKCELAPATGYKFPYVIKVMMGGRLLKQKNLLRVAGSEYYTYDNTTGIIEIENVDGEIVIEAKGVQEGFFEVIPNLVNLTSDPASFEPLAKDSKVELTLKAASGYTLPTSITVKMGENTLASTDYTYNSGTGAFALEKITATLVITAAGNRIPDPEPEPEPTPTTYMVTLPVVEGATLIAESSTNVESGKSFAFTLTLKDGYSAPQLTVKANGLVLGPVSSGRYVIEKVTSNIVVTVTGIVKDNPTDNAEVDPNGLRVWGENGRLHIQTPVMDTACIVTFEGRLYRNLSLPVGETITSIPQGSYIIYIGNQSYKIRF